jgi:hypothetical protein
MPVFHTGILMVTPFKTPVGVCQLPADKKAFNYGLSRVQIASEHCSVCFSEKNPLILDSRASRLLACKHCIEACMVLHNMLLEMNTNDDDEWINILPPAAGEGTLHKTVGSKTKKLKATTPNKCFCMLPIRH